MQSVYTDPEVLLQERLRIFNARWILACHQSEVPSPGDYLCLNIAGEPIVILRGDDGELRAFFNICVHRGFPIFESQSGRMSERQICGYHGWAYDRRGQFADRAPTKSCAGLKSIACEIFAGLIFVNMGAADSSVGEMLGSYGDEIAASGLADMIPAREKTFVDTVPVNWKLFIENTLEGHHVRQVHPGLDDLIGQDYDYAYEDWVFRTHAPLLERPARQWSTRAYQNINRGQGANAWRFFFIFPNVQISIYPEQIFYLQAIPDECGKTIVRGRFFVKPNKDEREGRRAAIQRYLNLRIGRKIYREDLPILKKWQASFRSRAFGDHLSLSADDEIVREFHARWTRAMT